MAKKLILIIGGPGSGKTTIINYLTKNGYTCFPEISRAVIKKAQEQGIDQLFLKDPLLFSQMLLDGRINQYQEAQNRDVPFVFIDRGIPDVLAYMDFIGDVIPVNFEEACVNHQYHQIFILPPWEAIYQSDAERYETYEQALEIQKHLIATYQKYGYQLIEVPKDTVENRVQFILNQIDN